MRYPRMIPLVAAFVLALAPLTAHAQSAAAASRASKLQANITNDIARCQLAAAGKAVPGKVAPSQPQAVAACGGSVRALQTLSSAPLARCPETSGRLSKQEMDQINAFEIALAKAQKKNLPAPQPSADLLALMNC